MLQTREQYRSTEGQRRKNRGRRVVKGEELEKGSVTSQQLVSGACAPGVVPLGGCWLPGCLAAWLGWARCHACPCSPAPALGQALAIGQRPAASAPGAHEVNIPSPRTLFSFGCRALPSQARPPPPVCIMQPVRSSLSSGPDYRLRLAVAKSATRFLITQYKSPANPRGCAERSVRENDGRLAT